MSIKSNRKIIYTGVRELHAVYIVLNALECEKLKCVKEKIEKHLKVGGVKCRVAGQKITKHEK